jgi:hypothetical protein
MAKKKTAKKGKRMAMGGLGMDDSDMRPASMQGRGMGREMEREEPEDGEARGRERGEMDDGMERGRDRERRMRRGRDREMERGMKRGRMDGYGRPAIGGGLPPVQTMGPGNMPAAPAMGANPPPKMPLGSPAALSKMPNSGMGAPAGLTQSGAQQGMMRNMGPNNMMPAKMRGGGIARKGKGLTMAKGGLVKGCGCAAKGVKKPRYT